ncbi:MAG: rod shape-determining protein MreC [Gammaproteobacteria bacterium]
MKPIFTYGPSVNARLIMAVVVSLAMMFGGYNQKHMKAVRDMLAMAVYPLHVVANLPLQISDWTIELFSSKNQIQAENAKLKKEILLLQAQQQKFAALENENMRLRDLLDSSLKVKDRVLIAELLAVDLDPYKQQVLINKGANSGVFEGQPVLDANAVMGQVTNVTPYSATVLMITDARHSLPVQILRTGQRAIAVGTGDINRLQVPHLPTNADIIVGDLLVTSGLGGRFPPGYPVATITDIKRVEGQAFIDIEATPDARLDHTREVLLVWTVDAPKEKIADKQQEEKP